MTTELAGPQTPRQASCASRRDLGVALLLGLLAFLVYNANLRSIPAVDTYAARYLPLSILRHHTLLLDPIAAAVAQGRKLPTQQGATTSAFWIKKGEGEHFVSLYPVVVPLVVAPLYLPAVAYLDARDWPPLLTDKVARIMEKLSASLIAAASVALLYLLLRRRAGQRTAAALSLAYAFGTTTWVISSQALWTHGLAQLLIVATLLLLTGPRTLLRVLAAGTLCALIAANRQPDTILAAGLALYGLWWAGRAWPWLVGAALIPAGLVVAYNLLVVGHIAGGYGLTPDSRFYNSAIWEGVAGLLFSPTRGLFVFSPFLLFVPCCLLLALRERRGRGLTVAIGLAMLVQVIGYGFVDWRQGISWGPRWLTDLLPLLMWMLPPVVAALSRPGRALFAVACAVAVVIQAIGAFWYTGAADSVVMTADGPDRMAPLWEVRNASFIAELRHGPPDGDLLLDVQGSLDRIDVGDVVVPGDAAGDRIERRVVIEGWALADERSPAGVSAMSGGRFVAGTNSFFPRADVAQTLGNDQPAGWKIEFAAELLQAGAQTVTIFVHGDSYGEARLLRARAFSLPSDSDDARLGRLLALAAQRAARVLADRQQPDGYWLTLHTSRPRFEQPQPEMNTYLNAILLDVVGPVAGAAGLDAALARARTFLSGQIEATGLVRYHGRPDAPTIGVLGCAITPDTDDTALVWRVAPSPDRALLRAALATIERFRRPDGLYRTWLAPQADYMCIDPGSDPNPADIGIQLNLLLLLAQEDPARAVALCAAIRRTADDDAVWAYYSVAPLTVIYRLADLRAAGCAVALPPARLRTRVPGQEIWIEVVQVIDRAQSGVATREDYDEAARLLRRIAASDFALLATVPPLVYHNDLTASVSRYYWSPELGYALWLRLYGESERMRLSLPSPAP